MTFKSIWCKMEEDVQISKKVSAKNYFITGGYNMDFRIISLPAFNAASSEADRNPHFSSNGILGKFNECFSAIRPSARDSFLPRGFLCFDEVK